MFLNPDYVEGVNEKYLPADEYLSGNVRKKLAEAQAKAAQDPQFQVNADALAKVQPVDLTASEISVRLGATWLNPEYIRQFMFETLGTPRSAQWNIKVHYSKITGEWRIEGKSKDRGNVKALTTYGTKRVNAYEIIEDSLNLKDVRVFDYQYDPDGRRVAVLNKKETAIAQSKQELLKEAFTEWIWKDPERRETICKAYDDVTIAGEMADWVDVLAIFAVKTAGSNDVDATDVVTMDADRVNRLKAVFSDMNIITSTVETIHHADSDPDDGTDDSWTEKILHITISGKTAVEMVTEYGFTAQQMTVVNELLAQRDMLEELIGNLTAISADAADILRNLPADLAPERREVIKTACSLVGKVNYFWGGKSLAMGWDSRWGTVQKVTADGSSSTGTCRPYGLDCSGFVDWVFYNATEGNYIIGHGGGAASQHTYCTAISWADALPGDLVFYPDDTHVGIVAGWDENGNILIVHCASGYNNVVITGKEGFTSVARPQYYAQ